MGLKRLKTRWSNKTVELTHAADVVRFSFIVNNSISYLDLCISKNSENQGIKFRLNRKIHILKHSMEYISTEEKCQKIFAPRRSLLYTLHLDLTKKRASSLKNDSKQNMERSIPHTSKLEISYGFYIDILTEFFEDAMHVVDEKSRLLRLSLKIPLLEQGIFKKNNIADGFIECFYPNIFDSVLFKYFIENFRLADWLKRYENPEILEFLLYHKRKHGIKLEDYEWFPISEITFECIFNGFFLNIGPILKYIDTPGVPAEYDYDSYIYEIPSLSKDHTHEVLRKSEALMSQQRAYLILISLWIFDKRNERPQCHEAATEALRLLWNCSSEAYMNFKDVQRAFGETHRYEELRDMYEFYCNSIGEDHSHIETRPLKHFCRAIIRKSLCKNKIWIPEGLRLMRLPKSLESFLNLEKQFIPS